MRGPTATGPPEVFPPVENPPAAVQETAFVEDQESSVDWPLSMVLGVAVRVACGEGGGVQVSGFALVSSV